MKFNKIVNEIVRVLEKRNNDGANETENIKLVRNAFSSKELPQSVLFFTHHKCASSFIMRFFNSVTNNSKYKIVNYYSILWNLGDEAGIFHYKPEPLFEDCYDILFKKMGHIYVPQRRPFDFPGRTQFKHIFFLRDPRDVLVSSYYSSAFTHVRPQNVKNFFRYDSHRNNIRELGINGYALKASNDWLVPLFNSYKVLKESSGSNIFLSYNEFLNNPINFINRIIEFIDVKMSDSEIKILSNSMSIKNNRDGKHVRSGENHQYLTELDRNTIEVLNERFHKILKYWRFEEY